MTKVKEVMLISLKLFGMFAASVLIPVSILIIKMIIY